MIGVVNPTQMKCQGFNGTRLGVYENVRWLQLKYID